MKPEVILFCFLIYTALIFFITWLTSRKATNESFYTGNRNSPWFVIAYGMIGASLSGVTFMSVPGAVGKNQFSYLMVVLGYLFGYLIIANVLLPLYYKMNLTSIYTYLEKRFGYWSYKSGAFFFIISRVLGASFRLFLVVNVLHIFVFQTWNIPFAVSLFLFIVLILLYTFKGGIKTIIWTDTLQTTFMVLALFVTVYIIAKQLDKSVFDLFAEVWKSDYSRIFIFDVNSNQFFLKQFLSGIFITIVMTGLDQEMMQKNISCKNLKDSQKNMLSFSVVLVFVNIVFLFLGAILYIYAEKMGIRLPSMTDDLFPVLALKYLGSLAGIVFIIGLISAAYPSADGALTSLTTSFCLDFLSLEKKKNLSEKGKTKIRQIVHLGFACVFFCVILIFKFIIDRAVIDKLLTVAGYTYGPLLGVFSFGIFTKRKIKDNKVPWIVLASPLICYQLANNAQFLFGSYKFGFELLLINGFLTFFGLWCISERANLVQKK